MKVVFLNRYFHPDHSATSQMLSDLAFALASRGLAVTVLTSRQRYDDPMSDLPPSERIQGVEVRRIWTSRFGRQALAGRALDYLAFYASAVLALLRHIAPGDIVVAKTDPPLLSVIAAPAAWWRRARVINWQQDIFPEVAEALGLGSGLARAPMAVLRRLRNLSIAAACANVAIGDRMAERLHAIGVPEDRIRVIPNWSDGELVRPVPSDENPLRAAWALGAAFVVGYSGNLGRAHEIETILGAIESLQVAGEESTAATVVWLFIGGGAQFEALRQETLRRRLRSVVFKPYQAREHLADSLSVPDVHLVSLRPELEGLIVPSKAYGIAAAGRPTIFIGDCDGEIARQIHRDGSGLTVPEGDSATLARTISDLAANPSVCRRLGERARSAFLAKYDKALAVDRWEALIRDVSGRGPIRPQTTDRNSVQADGTS